MNLNAAVPVDFVRLQLAERSRGVVTALAAAVPCTPGEFMAALEAGSFTWANLFDLLLTPPRSGRVVGYLHADGQRFMAPEVFDAWRALHATPEQAAQYGPVVRLER